MRSDILSKTSSEVKYRYNKKTYKAFNVQIKPELFEKIDNYCKQNNISRSMFLDIAINELSKQEKHN